MRNNCKILSLQWWQRKDTSHGGKFLARETTHYSRLAEQSLYRRVARCYRARVARCRAASALARSRLDGRYSASLTYQIACVEQQLIRVAYVLYIQQFHLRVGLGVKVLVHILQHVLNTYLLAVTNAPHAVKLQALYHRTLQNEHRRSARSRYKVNALWVQVWYWQREHAVVIAVQQSYAVWSYQRRTVFLARVQYVLLQLCSRLCLLAESRRDNNKRLCALLLAQIVHVVRTELRRYYQHRQFRLWYILHIVKGLYSLHFVFFGVYNVQVATVTTILNITYYSTTGLMHVVRAADHDYALRVQ